jgi:hypothetical protein
MQDQTLDYDSRELIDKSGDRHLRLQIIFNPSSDPIEILEIIDADNLAWKFEQLPVIDQQNITRILSLAVGNRTQRDPRETYGGEDRTFEDHRSNELED